MNRILTQEEIKVLLSGLSNDDPSLSEDQIDEYAQKFKDFQFFRKDKLNNENN